MARLGLYPWVLGERSALPSGACFCVLALCTKHTEMHVLILTIYRIKYHEVGFDGNIFK